MKKNTFRRCVVTALVLTASIAVAFAVSPKFSLKLNGAIGAYNILGNRYVNEVPGLSDNVKLDFKFDVKGSFSNEGNSRSASYYSGAYLNVDKLYRNSVSYRGSSDKYGNSFDKLQGMIDWYEANYHRYDLAKPDWSRFPFASEFIKGTTVVDSSNVLWTNEKWEHAKVLTAAIEDVINDRIAHMFETKGIGVGTTITQMDYDDATETQKKYILIKQEAFNSFRNGMHGISYPAASAYAEFTNIANLLDIRVDLGNARLKAGKVISSARTAQGAYGSSVRLGLNSNVLKGLDAGLTLGVAGGEKQIPENWDSRNLDYTPGKYAELGLKLDVDYTYELQDLKLDITAGMDFLMPDLLVASANNAGAFRIGAHYNDFSEYIDSYGFYIVDPKTIAHEIEASDVFEFTYGLTKDRYDLYDKKASFVYGLKNEVYVSAYGAELRFDAAFKSARFESKWSNPVTEGRKLSDNFSGLSIEQDYVTANAYATSMINIDLAYDTFRLLNSRIFRINAGFDALIYGNKLIAKGFDVEAQVNLVDYVKQDLILKGGVSYYKNDLVNTFGDRDKGYKALPMTSFTFTAGVEYAPAKTFKCNLDFKSAPSFSSVDYKTRILSAEARFTVSY